MVFCCNGKEIRMVLEPICTLTNDKETQHKIIGFEALSDVVGLVGEKENYFNLLSDSDELSLLQWQLMSYQKLVQQDQYLYEDKFIAVNVSCSLLSRKLFWAEFIPYVLCNKIVVELDCDEFSSFVTNDVFIENVNFLKSIGIDFWLDDLKDCSEPHILSLIEKIDFSVIKIDKNFFWDSYKKRVNISKVQRVVSSGMSILAEGIETIEHIIFAKFSSIRLGQGYFWDPVRV